MSFDKRADSDIVIVLACIKVNQFSCDRCRGRNNFQSFHFLLIRSGKKLFLVAASKSWWICWNRHLMWQQLWSFLRCSCFSHLSLPSWFTLCRPTIVKSTTRKSPIILGRQLTCVKSFESPEYEINIYSKPIIRLVLSSWTNAGKKTFVSHSTTQLQHVCLSDVFHITEARRNNVNDWNHNNPRSYFPLFQALPKNRLA